MAGVDKRLTDLTELSNPSDNAFIHVVEPSDISQNPAGSSYKVKKSNFGGLSDAPINGSQYARKDGVWAVVSSGIEDAPIDSVTYGRKNGAWSNILSSVLSGLTSSSGTFTSSNTILEAFGRIKYLIDNIATTYQAILTDVNFGSFINGLTSKPTPVDADSISIVDNADSNKQKKVSLTNFKSFLKTYFDTLYKAKNTGIVYYKSYRNNASNITTNGVNTYLFSISIPVTTILPSDTLEVRVICAKASGTATANPKWYLSTTSGALTQQIGVETLRTTSNSHFTAKRTYYVDTNTQIFATEFGAVVTDEQLSLAGGTAPITLTGSNSFANNMFLDFSITNNGAGNSSNIYYAELIVYRSY